MARARRLLGTGVPLGTTRMPRNYQPYGLREIRAITSFLSTSFVAPSTRSTSHACHQSRTQPYSTPAGLPCLAGFLLPALTLDVEIENACRSRYAPKLASQSDWLRESHATQGGPMPASGFSLAPAGRDVLRLSARPSAVIAGGAAR